MKHSVFKFLSIIFSNKCAYCKSATENVLCSKCASFVKTVREPLCDKCGKPIFACVCDNGRKKLPYEKCLSLFEYNNIKTTALIYKIKEKGNRTAVLFIASKMAELIKSGFKDVEFDCVTYVPSSRFSRIRKGFDHAGAIAKEISEILDVPVILPPIVSRSSIRLKFLNKKTRKNVVKRKFVPNKYKIEGKVLLVDDVMTTGETLFRCSEIIKEKGAKEIYCITAATVVKKNKKT